MALSTITAGLNGQVLGVNAVGNLIWARPVFYDEFDMPWRDKYSIKCNRMCLQVRARGDATLSYGRVYWLCEFLWKLNVWKP